MVREAVANEAQLALFRVLHNRVKWLGFRDLELCVGPARDLYDHVEDVAQLVRPEGDVMERRQDLASRFVGQVDAVLCERSNADAQLLREFTNALSRRTKRIWCANHSGRVLCCRHLGCCLG